MTRMTTAPPTFRRPGSIDLNRLPVAQAVQHREHQYRAVGWTMLALGIPATLVAPMLIAAVAPLVQRYGHTRADTVWATTFALASLVVTPVLFWMERRLGASRWLVWGPRMIRSAVERLQQPVPAGVLNESAAVLAYLRHFHDGVAVDELPTIQTTPALDYLLSRQWVDLTPDGRQVRLPETSRRALGYEIR